MHHVTKMLETHPQATANEALARCIEQCFACALTCTSCADACLAEEQVQELVRCIRLNLDCADVRRDRTSVDATDALSATAGAEHARSLRAVLPRLWGGVRAARTPSRALPSLRRGLPALRAGL
jgi:hypothetical protein